MCGIFGIFQSGRPLSGAEKEWAKRAQQLLEHRGPDGNGNVTLLNGSCLLGHLRLSIIDLEGGAQPICNEDRTIWLVCNGEVYNYLELREGLLQRGHQFSTRSDNEVLVHLYEEKGARLLDDLEGMFAFAVVDTIKQEIFLARDRFGEKPLYFAPLSQGKGIAFASEMKALPLSEIDRSLDLAAIAQFLSLNYIPAPRTHLRGVRKLQAGESLTVSPQGELRAMRFWKPEFMAGGDHAAVHKDQAIEDIRERLREAVGLRLRSDVTVGAFLSGGIDSTLIAATIRELQPDVCLKTFCAVFEDKELNEAPYARVIAEQIGSEHYEVHISSEDLLQIFDGLIEHYDEPFADASMFPTYAVCRAAKRHCKVMLTGDGGDELFGGYREFYRYFQWHPVRRFPGINPLAQKWHKHWPERWRGGDLLNFLKRNDWELLHAGEKGQGTMRSFRSSHIEEVSSGLDELCESAERHSHLPFPLSAMEATASGYLPEQILVKVDRASMLNPVECRAPFLDQKIFNYAAKLPFQWHFEGGQGKALLRQCLPSWVSPEIRRRAKQGFTPPLARWLRTSLREQMQEAISVLRRQFGDVFDTSGITELNRQHLEGADHSTALFRWLVLSRSLEKIGCAVD